MSILLGSPFIEFNEQNLKNYDSMRTKTVYKYWIYESDV